MLGVVWAPRCAVCDETLDTPTGGPVCPDCWSAIPVTTPPICCLCGEPSLSTDRARPAGIGTAPAGVLGCPRCPPDTKIQRRRAVGPYDGTLRLIIHAFKYDGRRSLSTALGALMRRAASDLLEAVDGAVPVPLHWIRRWKRGFDQAEVLARDLGLPVLDVLCRTRRTAPQATLSSPGRRRNVQAAFSLSRGTASVAGRRLVLVDDVRTTGATLEACAAVLLAGGAREVSAVTVAATTRPARPPRRSRRPRARRQS